MIIGMSGYFVATLIARFSGEVFKITPVLKQIWRINDHKLAFIHSRLFHKWEVEVAPYINIWNLNKV